jgi:hypothetical protein
MIYMMLMGFLLLAADCFLLIGDCFLLVGDQQGWWWWCIKTNLVF